MIRRVAASSEAWGWLAHGVKFFPERLYEGCRADRFKANGTQGHT